MARRVGDLEWEVRECRRIVPQKAAAKGIFSLPDDAAHTINPKDPSQNGSGCSLGGTEGGGKRIESIGTLTTWLWMQYGGTVRSGKQNEPAGYLTNWP